MPHWHSASDRGDDPDVADVAGAAVGAGVEPAVDDDAGADAGGDLDQAQRRGGRRGRRRTPRGPRRRRRWRSAPGRRAARPAGARRPGRRPSPAGSAAGWAGPDTGSIGPGRLSPAPQRSTGRDVVLLEQRRSARPRSGRAPPRARPRPATSISVSPSTVPPRSVTAIRVWVVSTAAASDARLGGVEGQAAPAAPAGGLAGLALDDHPGAEQRVEPLRDGHPGQAGQLEHVAARGGPAVPDQLEDVAGAVGHGELECNDWAPNA